MRDSNSNKDQEEPSMDEILASIRRIISEDVDETVDGGNRPKSSDEVDMAADYPQPMASVVKDDGSDDDILELTDVVANDGLDDDILELTDVVEDQAETKLDIEIGEDDEKLVSEEVEEVSVATMYGLTDALASNAKVGAGEKTLEALTKELLRPALKQWLDENLPDMVQRIVREEIERIGERVRK